MEFTTFLLIIAAINAVLGAALLFCLRIATLIHNAAACALEEKTPVSLNDLRLHCAGAPMNTCLPLSSSEQKALRNALKRNAEEGQPIYVSRDSSFDGTGGGSLDDATLPLNAIARVPVHY
jgi:hypothetical protein